MQPSGRPHFLISHLVYLIIYKVAYETKPKENLKWNLKKIEVVENCSKGHITFRIIPIGIKLISSSYNFPRT
jgi:hypothetical protein